MADPKAGKHVRRLVGLGVSRGVGRGNVVFFRPGSRPLVRTELNGSEIDQEIRRFRDAVEVAKEQLRSLAPPPVQGDENAASDIFAVQVLILESSLIENTEIAIRERKINSEWALKRVLREYSERHAALPDGHLREKLLDIEDVAGRLARVLRGGRSSISIEPHSVIVARDLRPSAIVELAKLEVAGLITETGGWTSHMSIIARECHLPMVAGIRDVEEHLSTGDLVVVDGNAGEVIIDADNGDSAKGRKSGATTMHYGWNSKPVLLTADGVEVIIRTNSESVDAYRIAERMGAKGIGLYRSESLSSDQGFLPTEEEQFSAYSEMARAVGDDGVSIRTFDIPREQFLSQGLNHEANPALGLRAIRFGLTEPEVFRAQIRAILRASEAGKIDVILPMISNVEEIIQARSLVEAVREEYPGVAKPRIGVMVEIPSAVLAAPLIAKHADFLCIGTNDLVQYLLAVDRDNVAVADWYQTLHPAVLSAIRMVLEAAGSAGIPTNVCGEMAGSTFYVPVLLGLGAREFSINTNSVSAVSRLLTCISAADSEALVKRLETTETAAQNERLLRDFYLANWKDCFPAGIVDAIHH